MSDPYICRTFNGTAVEVRLLPRWLPMQGITLFGRIYVKSVTDIVTIEHEWVHVQQQRAHPIWFWVSYLLLAPILFNPFRLRWEAEAYGKVEAHCGYTSAELARWLAGPLYGWCCRRQAAEEAIVKWRDAK